MTKGRFNCPRCCSSRFSVWEDTLTCRGRLSGRPCLYNIHTGNAWVHFGYDNSVDCYLEKGWPPNDFGDVARRIRQLERDNAELRGRVHALRELLKGQP